MFSSWNVSRRRHVIVILCWFCADGGSELDAGEDLGSCSEISSGEDTDTQSVIPCRYYNRRGCRDGNRCLYHHVCQYFLKGDCRYGSSCKLSHSMDLRPPSDESNDLDQGASADVVLTDGRCYQWQLNDGNGWMDIGNDHVIEAQYSLPHSKSIKIYNTPYGAVCIDLNRMRVSSKSLRVRRLDDGNTEWVWYCTLRHKWVKYGEKDVKGNCSPVRSSDIEEKFQSNPTSSFTFSIGVETFEIRFKDMRQVGMNRSRKVIRRPQYQHRQPDAGVSQVAPALQRFSLDTKPRWQFEGDRGGWHEFKHRSGTQMVSSVTSDDIERAYQQNQHGSMTFTVNGQPYKLDFRAMTQNNLRNKHTRRIRRVLE
ncbi:uncharacterized protein ACBR49_010690 isoform 2-T2 [Aulostomus maculatus]